MPRQARLDASGTLDHVMGRGIEKTKIFREDGGREDFVCRLGDLSAEGIEGEANGMPGGCR